MFVFNLFNCDVEILFRFKLCLYLLEFLLIGGLLLIFSIFYGLFFCEYIFSWFCFFVCNKFFFFIIEVFF